MAEIREESSSIVSWRGAYLSLCGLGMLHKNVNIILRKYNIPMYQVPAPSVTVGRYLLGINRIDTNVGSHVSLPL